MNRLKRKAVLFSKLRTARLLKAKNNVTGVSIGFKDRAERRGKDVKYARHEQLGLTVMD